MYQFVLSTDTTCDVFKSELKKDQIEYIPMCFICDGEIHYDEFDSEQEYLDFYKSITDGKMYSTTGLNQMEVEEYFTRLLETYQQDIVHLCLSSGLSMTCGLVKSVAKELNEKNEHKIYVVDSLSATIGSKYLLEFLKKFRNEGMDALKAYSEINHLIEYLDVSFYVTDLDCLKRGGRVSGAAAMIGKMLSIRPMIDIDPEGKLRVIGKPMGDKKAIKALVDRFMDRYNKEMHPPVLIAYTDNLPLAEELEKTILNFDSTIQVVKGMVGPVIGSHTGGGLLGLGYFGVEERK